MIFGITTALFLAGLMFVWTRNRDIAGGVAFALASGVAIAVAIFAAVTGLFGLLRDQRVEAIFCGILLTFAFAFLGIVRS